MKEQKKQEYAPPYVEELDVRHQNLLVSLSTDGSVEDFVDEDVEF